MKLLRALTTFAVTLSVACTPLALAGGADAAVKKRRTGTAYIRVVSFNTQLPQSTERALSDVKRLVDAKMGVIALQEMMGRERRTALREQFVDCETCRYEGLIAERNTEGANPILWKTPRFSLVDSGNVQVTDDWYVGARGAGPTTFQEKFVTWVQLAERRTGRMFYVLNTHMIPSVQGRDGYPNQEYPERLAHFRQHMSALQDLIRQFQATGLPVFVTGDFNVNYRRDKVIKPAMFPYASLGAVGVRASYAATSEPSYGTHGGGTRLIDYVAHTVSSKVKPVSTEVLLGYNSDHRPVVGTFGLD